MKGSRVDALAVLAEVASWDRAELAPDADVCWVEDHFSLIM